MKTKTFYMFSETPMDDPKSIPESRLEDFGDIGTIAVINARNADHARKKLRQGEGISLAGAKLTCQEVKGSKCLRYATTKDAKCVSEPPSSPLKRRRKPKPPEEAVSWCSDFEVIDAMRLDREGEPEEYEKQVCIAFTPNCLNPSGVVRVKAVKPKVEARPKVTEKPKISGLNPWDMDKDTWNQEYTVAKKENNFAHIEHLTMGISTKESPGYVTYGSMLAQAIMLKHQVSDQNIFNLPNSEKTYIDEILEDQKLRSNSITADPKDYNLEQEKRFKVWEVDAPPIIRNSQNPPELKSAKDVYFLKTIGRRFTPYISDVETYKQYDFEIAAGERLLIPGFEDIPIFAHKETLPGRVYYEATEGDTGLSLNITDVKKDELALKVKSQFNTIGREKLLDNLKLFRKIHEYGPNFHNFLAQLENKNKLLRTEGEKRKREEKKEAIGRQIPIFRNWEIDHPPSIINDDNLPRPGQGQELFLAKVYRKKEYGHIENHQDYEHDYNWLAGVPIKLQGFNKIRFYAVPYERLEGETKRSMWGLFNADNGELFTKLWWLDDDVDYQTIYNSARKEVRGEKKDQQKILSEIAKSRLIKDYQSINVQLLKHGIAWIKTVQPLWVPSETPVEIEAIPQRMKSSIFGEITIDTIREAGKYYLAQGNKEHMKNYEILQNSKGEWLYYRKDEPNIQNSLDLSKIETLLISSTGIPIRSDKDTFYRYTSEIVSEDDKKYLIDVKSVSFDKHTRIPSWLEYSTIEIPKEGCRQLLNTADGLILLLISPSSTRSGTPWFNQYYKAGLTLPLTYYIENKPERMEKARPPSFTEWHEPLSRDKGAMEYYYDTREKAEEADFHFGKNTQDYYKHGAKVTERTLVGIDKLSSFPMLSPANLLRWAILNPFVLP